MIEELLKQKAQIEAQIAAHRSQEREAAIKTVRQLVTAHSLTAADIGIGAPRAKLLTATVRVKADKRISVTPKFRGPNGELWSGRGLQPRWLRDAIGSGASLEQFRIAA